MKCYYRISGVLFLTILSVGCIRSAGMGSDPVSSRPVTPEVRNSLSSHAQLDATLVQFKKGVQLLENGRTEEARLLFEGLRDVYPRMSIFHVNLGVTYKRLGLLPEAISSYQRALEIERDDAGIHYDLAIALREHGEFRKSEEAYKTALAISPDFMDAHYNLAVLYDLYLNEPAEAIRHYQRFLELGGGDPKEIQIWITALQKRMDESRRSP